ncbi:mucolipin-3-like [Amphibalanus amphitrite]|uniref:mucolipin-3-like n=1 Tax=Amphibalanus amphitrite TaxID=1232801 RepID=UPI001C908DFB|nr:mucolipin-3-like [Amphibalanus amphitrite]
MIGSPAVVSARLSPSPSPCPSPVLRRRQSAASRNVAADPGSHCGSTGQGRFEHFPADDPAQQAAGERVRRKLQFFFMNPIEKYRARKKLPFKLSLQIFKVVLITIQLSLFATSRLAHVSFLENTQFSLDHLFILGWDVTREVNVYPPGAGPLAVYSQQSYFETLDFAVNAYHDLDNLTVSGIGYTDDTVPPVRLCLNGYRRARVFPANLSYAFDAHVRQRCLDLRPTPVEIQNHNFSTRAFLGKHDFNVSFVALTRTTLSFALNAVRLKEMIPANEPDCYRLQAALVLENGGQDGRMLVRMNVESHLKPCNGNLETSGGGAPLKVFFTIISSLVIVVCISSFAMCMRSMYRAQLLRIETVSLLHEHFEYDLTYEEQLRFLNLWYVLIIINDGLIVFASLIHIQLDIDLIPSPIGVETWNLCAVVLGAGNLLVWVGMLRYFSFFKSYNVLILTVKSAMPSVLRFSVCATISYAGFVFCGWLVLAPYHLKFRTISKTSETLFSLMNGDDMFATFAQVWPRSSMIYWFSKLYIYVFIFFFIYVVISLMISIIMDSYETIKAFYRDGFPMSPLDEFLAVRRSAPETGVYREDEDDCSLRQLCCCVRRRGDADRQPIIAAVDDNGVTAEPPLLRTPQDHDAGDITV